METPPPAPPRRSFARNALWLLIAESVGKVASFVFVVVVARGLGAAEYGAFAFAMAFVAPFFSLSAWGLEVSTIRDVSRDPSRFGRLFGSGLTMRVLFGLVALGLSVAVSPLLVDSADGVLALAIVGAALLCDEVSSFLRALFRSFDRMEFHAVVVLANRVLTVVFALVAFQLGAGLIAVSVTYLLGSAAAMAFGFLALRRYLPAVPSWKPDAEEFKRLCKLGAPLALASVLNMLTFRVDTVLLQSMKGAVAVANYGIAYRFFESFLFVAYNLGDTAMPRIARAGPSPEGSRVFVATVALVLTFYLPLAVSYAVGGEWIVVKLFSAKYEAAADAMVWLGFGAALYAIAVAARICSIALGRRREMTVVAFIALVANVSMNAYAIPKHGIVGAAATTFFTMLIEAVILVGLVLRTTAALERVRIVAVPLVGAAAMAAAALALRRPGPVAIAVGLVVYGVVALAAARVLAPGEFGRVARLLNKVRPKPVLPREAE